jgi:hypothetical protein
MANVEQEFVVDVPRLLLWVVCDEHIRESIGAVCQHQSVNKPILTLKLHRVGYIYGLQAVRTLE